MFAEGFHGNRVNCDASRQRQRLYYCRDPFVFSLNVSEQLYFLTDTLSLCNKLFRFLVWFGAFFFLPSTCHGCTEEVRWAARMTMKCVFLFFFFLHRITWTSWFELLYLFVSDNDATGNGRTRQKRKKKSDYSIPTSTIPKSVECFNCSGRTNSFRSLFTGTWGILNARLLLEVWTYAIYRY